MGIVTTIVDALRRFGTPTQKSAIKRQDDYLGGQPVVGRRSQTLRGELGQASAFVATVSPDEEAVSLLSADVLGAILANAERIDRFLAAFPKPAASDFFLDRLDKAFAKWITATDPLGYSSDDVIEITGAAFGRFCAETLDLRWVEVVDRYGQSIAIERDGGRVRGFPFDAVAKRIQAQEWGFFKPIYIALQDAASLR